MLLLWNLGPVELIIILVIVLVLFGAGRLPEVAKSLGKGIREFRKASRDAKKPLEEDEAKKTPAEKADKDADSQKA